MSEKEFLKEKDLLLNSIEKNTVDHWKNYYSNVPIKCIFEDLVIDINEIKKLTNENQSLKKQLEDNKNKYNTRLINQISENIEPDCEDFYLAEIEEKSNEYDKLKNRQKEFIEYLENEINKWHHNYDSNTYEYELEEPTAEDYANEILQKYKEIIGGKDENRRN